MSTAPTNTVPPVSTAGVSRKTRSQWLVAGGTMIAALIAVLTIALWPASEADKARADGEQLGQAVADLYYADDSTEVDAALTDINAALVDTHDHAGDAVASQVDKQADALSRAAEGYVGSVTSTDSFESDVYQAELDVAVGDLRRNADSFQAQGSDVEQAYAEGFNDGLNGN